METGLISQINTFCTWFGRMVFLNLLWLFFTVIGIGIFGFFPSTIAMITVIKSWLRKDDNQPIAFLFWKTYKREFLKSQSLGLFALIIGVILLLDFHFIFSPELSIPIYIQMIFLLMGITYIITILYTLSLYVFLKMNFKSYIKNSIILVFTHPMHSLILVISCFIMIYLSFRYAGMLLFFTGSILALIMATVTQDIIRKVKTKSIVQ